MQVSGIKTQLLINSPKRGVFLRGNFALHNSQPYAFFSSLRSSSTQKSNYPFNYPAQFSTVVHTSISNNKIINSPNFNYIPQSVYSAQITNWRRQIIFQVSIQQSRRFCNKTSETTSQQTSNDNKNNNDNNNNESNIENAEKIELQKRKEELLNLSLDELHKRAEQGEPESLFLLGWYHFFGEKELEKSTEKTVYYYQKAAENNHPHAYYLLAQFYFEGIHFEKNEAKAVEMLEKAADLQHVYALYDLGCCYYYGNGVEKDIHKAIKYFEIAGSEKGQADALSLLGSIYYYGEEGVEVDQMKGIKYFDEAAKLGDKDALYNLGCYYLEGAGVEKDIQKAIHFLTAAAEKDDSDACFNLANLYFHGEEGVPADEAKGMTYCKKAAALGDLEAQFAVGQMLVNDQSTFDDGASYLRFAANRGHEEAKALCDKLNIPLTPPSHKA